MPVLILIVNAVKQFLKQKRVSKGINRALTLFTAFVSAFGIMALLVFGMLYVSSHGFFADKGGETYGDEGLTGALCKGEPPLTVEDLLDVDGKGYIKECSGDSSLLLGQYTIRQHPQYDAKNDVDIPQLEYTVVIVRAPALYGMCKGRLLHNFDKMGEYKEEIPEPWAADEVYRLYDWGQEATNRYLLCYEDVLAEIRFD